MTTIAWDGKTLATDSLNTADGIIISSTAQKIFLDIGDYVAVAISGDTAAMIKFVEWLKEKQGKHPKADGAAFCVDRTGELSRVFPSDEELQTEIDPGFIAGGTGWEIALGALDAGKTAVEAVKIAIGRDVYSGGEIQSYTFNSEG